MATLFSAFMIVFLAVTVVGLALLPFRASRRRGKRLAGLGLLMFIASTAGASYLDGIEAKRLGFEDSTDMRDARAEGVADPEAWHALTRERETRRQALFGREKELRALREKAEAEAADAKRAQEKKADAEAEAERKRSQWKHDAEKRAAAAKQRQEEAAVEKAEADLQLHPKYAALDSTTDPAQTWLMSKAMDAVRLRLRDPQSAQFRNVFLATGSTGITVTCGDVNAKNAFGGFIGYESFISDGMTVSKLASEFKSTKEFLKAWKKFCQ